MPTSPHIRAVLAFFARLAAQACRRNNQNTAIVAGVIMARNVDDIRNIAICGHGSAGKTTLVDQLLVKTGAATGQPSVDNGTSICDFDEEEKHHKHSIEASIVHFDHSGKRFNVIDTP